MSNQLMEASIRSSLMNCMWCLRFFVSQKCAAAFHRWYRASRQSAPTSTLPPVTVSSPARSILHSDHQGTLGVSNPWSNNAIDNGIRNIASGDVDLMQRRQLIGNSSFYPILVIYLLLY